MSSAHQTAYLLGMNAACSAVGLQKHANILRAAIAPGLLGAAVGAMGSQEGSRLEGALKGGLLGGGLGVVGKAVGGIPALARESRAIAKLPKGSPQYQARFNQGVHAVRNAPGVAIGGAVGGAAGGLWGQQRPEAG